MKVASYVWYVNKVCSVRIQLEINHSSCNQKYSEELRKQKLVSLLQALKTESPTDIF
jgi:dihydroorotate dehydrogenase